MHDSLRPDTSANEREPEIDTAVSASNEGATVTVRFTVPAASGAQRAVVAGDFNEWDIDADVMQRSDDGTMYTDVELAVGRAYRFRYLLDDDRWENDWNADRYEPNEYGGDDSVVDLTDGGLTDKWLDRSVPSQEAAATTLPEDGADGALLDDSPEEVGGLITNTEGDAATG